MGEYPTIKSRGLEGSIEVARRLLGKERDAHEREKNNLAAIAATAERERDEARALVRELVEALREIDEMPDEEPAGWSPIAHGADWTSYTRARQQAIARSARLKARASGYTEEGE